MVIGTGLIAKKFHTYNNDENFLIFASGVSNSKSIVTEDFKREFDLLKETIKASPQKELVYFSTCSIYDESLKNAHYVIHKRELENYIQSTALNYHIFRVSNVVGGSGNPSTVLNFFTNQVKNGLPFDLWLNATRNLIDVDDFYEIANNILKNGCFANTIINIANPYNHYVREIVAEIENFYKKRANYTPVDKGSDFLIDISAIRAIIAQLNLPFGDGYLKNLLNKYYSEL